MAVIDLLMVASFTVSTLTNPLELAVDVLFLPLPDQFRKFLSAKIMSRFVLLSPQCILNDCLRRNTRVIAPW